MVERALRGVVREALTQAAESGLPGSHHFYLTFITGAPGVAIPEHRHQQYPEEMTIVLQNQFFGLEIRSDAFSVTLSFSQKHERLTLPFAALTTLPHPHINSAHHYPPPFDGGEIEP